MLKINLLDPIERDSIAKFIKDNDYRLSYNRDIFQILEGNLAPLLDERMLDDLGAKSAKAASTRKAPVNVFKQVVTKQTKIYGEPVIRQVIEGTEEDKANLIYYENILNLNNRMGVNNGFFNAYVYSILQIALKDIDPNGAGTPFVRSIPNHNFLVMSATPEDPTSPDVIILCMGTRPSGPGKNDPIQKMYWVWTDEQMIIMDADGQLIDDLMKKYDLEGENRYEVLPFTYVNGSENLVMPEIQSDNKEIALLIPLLLTDLNYAVKYQAFSVFVGIDIDDKSVELSPNSILSFRSQANDEGATKPSFEVVKPTVDIAQTLSLASSEMSLYLVTKGMRPSTVGQIGADQFASGISKMIDESDTYDSIKAQIKIYERVEQDFWKRLQVIHNYWVDNKLLKEIRPAFSKDCKIKTTFTQPEPMLTRMELINQLKTEVDAGFTTVEYAIKKLYPNMDEKEIDQHIANAKAEKAQRAPQTLLPANASGGGGAA